jgi:hypothetical protein
MKQILFKLSVILISYPLIFAACSKTDEANPAPQTNNSTLASNTWMLDDKLSKLSQYGFGWASTDFSPRAGWTDFTSDKTTRAVEVSFLTKPVAAGTYTVEEYVQVHLNKNNNKLSGNKVGIIARFGATEYQSVPNSGSMVIIVASGKTKLVFKDVIVKETLSTKTAKVSGNLEFAN